MTSVKEKSLPTIQNENLKNLVPFSGKKAKESAPKTPLENSKADLSKATKTPETSEAQPIQESVEARNKASEVATALAKVPVLPIVVPTANSAVKLEKKMADLPKEKPIFIKKPAVIFIEGFSTFGISNGDGIQDMADNFPGAKRFDWNNKSGIVEEIKKHAHDQPVVLVGHSFGGDTAVEVANELNSVKNSFRQIDLLVSLDSVGFNNSIMPMNVKRNLNFFQEGLVPFLHGTPTVARNTDYTEVINELRNELHSKIEDSPEVQYKIFENINEVLTDNDQEDIFVQMSVKDFIDNHLSSLKK